MKKFINTVLVMGNVFWIFSGVCMFVIQREADAIMSPGLASAIIFIMLVMSIAFLLAISYQVVIQEHVRKNGWLLLSGILLFCGSNLMYFWFFNGFALWAVLDPVNQEMYRLYYGSVFTTFRIVLTIYFFLSLLMGLSSIHASIGTKELLPFRPRFGPDGREI